MLLQELYAGDTPRRQEAILVDQRIVVSSCLVFFYISDQKNSRALGTGYRSIDSCDWSSSRDERLINGEISLRT